jgi:DNA polymerase III subunit delta
VSSGPEPTPWPPVHLLRGSDPSLVRDHLRHVVDELLGDRDPVLTVEDITIDGRGVEDRAPQLRALVEAAQTPPFLTDRRIVIGRNLNAATADELTSLAAYLGNPLPTSALVLAWESGPVPRRLLDAVKRSGGVNVDTSPQRSQQKQWIASQIAESGVRLDPGAQAAVTAAIGEDIARLRGLLETLESTYGDEVRLSEAEVVPYLGEAGIVAPYELTDAIDRGDAAGAIDRLHRIHGPDRWHALQVMASLQSHFGRMLVLDGARARGERDAAELLGLRGSTYPAKKALEQGRRLGSERVARAVRLLARADLDLRGKSGLPADVVLEVLVARLATLARR